MATLNTGEFRQNIQLGIEVLATLAFALSGIWRYAKIFACKNGEAENK